MGTGKNRRLAVRRVSSVALAGRRRGRGLVVVATWLGVQRSAPRADRNVLLVTIDTLRGDALGSYGGRAATPNLDKLAARGARFTFAHAHAVLTLPSHASILTGRYPYEHGDPRQQRLPRSRRRRDARRRE